ncbi:unnamed protein product, partial [Didymodactylos carnosus]
IAQLRFHRRSGIIDVNKSPHPNGQMNVVYRNSPTRSGKSGSSRSRPPTTDLHSSGIKQDSDNERDNGSTNRTRTTQDPAPFKASNHNPVSKVVKSGADETVITSSDTGFHKIYRIIDENKASPVNQQGNIAGRLGEVQLQVRFCFNDQSASMELHNAGVGKGVFGRDEDQASEKVEDTSMEAVERDEDPASANDGNASREEVNRDVDEASEKADEASEKADDTSREQVNRDEDQASEKAGNRSPLVEPSIVDGKNSQPLDREENSIDREGGIRMEISVSFIDQSPSTGLRHRDSKQDSVLTIPRAT